jgi:hypothetical protein
MPMEIEKGNTKDADQSDGERGGVAKEILMG